MCHKPGWLKFITVKDILVLPTNEGKLTLQPYPNHPLAQIPMNDFLCFPKREKGCLLSWFRAHA
jgi:hypothetical protein